MKLLLPVLIFWASLFCPFFAKAEKIQASSPLLKVQSKLSVKQKNKIRKESSQQYTKLNEVHVKKLVKIQQDSYKKIVDLTRHRSEKHKIILIESSEKLSGIFAAEKSVSKRNKKLKILKKEKQRKISELNQWYEEQKKQIELEKKNLKKKAYQDFETKKKIIFRNRDLRLAGKNPPTAPMGEKTPHSGDAPQVESKTIPTIPGIGKSTKVPEKGLPTPPKEALPDIWLKSLSYKVGDHSNGLRALPDKVPPLATASVIKTRECTIRKLFYFVFQFQPASNSNTNRLSFQIRATLDQREVVSMSQSHDPGWSGQTIAKSIELGIGEHILSVMLDSSNSVLENNENNNRLFARVNVVPHRGLELDCTSSSNVPGVASNSPASRRAADLGGQDKEIKTPDEKIIDQILTQADLVVELPQPMAPEIVITNKGKSDTIVEAPLQLTCQKTDEGECPSNLLAEIRNPIMIPPLRIDQEHRVSLESWPSTWKWARGSYLFIAKLNEDKSVPESPANNTATSTKEWNPTVPEIAERCMGCHKMDNTGSAPSPGELVEIEGEKGFERMLDTALGGARGMPDRGGIDWLTDAEVEEVARYLISLGGPTAFKSSGGMPEGVVSSKRSISSSDKPYATKQSQIPLEKKPSTPHLPTTLPGTNDNTNSESTQSTTSSNATAPSGTTNPRTPTTGRDLGGTVPGASTAKGTSGLRERGSAIYRRHVSEYNELLANIDKAKRERERRERMVPSGTYYGTYGLDCDDNNPAVHPHAAEIPCDTIDNNCDGTVNEGAPEQYLDADEDGWGDGNRSKVYHCAAIGYSARKGDCDDSNFDVRPDAPEIPGNEIDENCNGSLEN